MYYRVEYLDYINVVMKKNIKSITNLSIIFKKYIKK